MCEQISCNSFKDKITYKSYSNVCKEMTGVILHWHDG